MPFNSLQFIVFLPLAWLILGLTPPALRWLTLLAASYYYYMAWQPAHALLLLLVTLNTYAGALLISRAAAASRRRAWLLACLAVNLGALICFKYLGFFSASLSQALTLWGAAPWPALHWAQPVGLSFYTFMTLSYVIDVYRGQLAPEVHPGRYASYAAFFPVLLAGPITRGRDLLPQLGTATAWNFSQVVAGSRLILLGLFKKVVVADRLAVLVKDVYGHPTDFGGLYLLAATISFTLQIYYDFSGYTDLARGAAQVLGYHLPDNFNRPYAARSFAEFWRRWHISLSTWFRDYLYIPLGGRRVARSRWYFNLLLTFVVSGLWHGANWTFLAWGALHGALVVLDVATQGPRRRLTEGASLARLGRLQGFLGWLLTLAGVSFAWIFFRANSLADALYIVGHLFSGWERCTLQDFFMMGVGQNEWILIIFFMSVIEGADWVKAHQPNWSWQSVSAPLRWGVYYAALMIIIFLGISGQVDFVYMRF